MNIQLLSLRWLENKHRWSRQMAIETPFLVIRMSMSTLFIVIWTLFLTRSSCSSMHIISSFTHYNRNEGPKSESYKTNMVKNVPQDSAARTTQASNLFTTENGCEVENMLTNLGFGNRIFTLSEDYLRTRPIPSEIYQNGNWNLCLIVGLISSPQARSRSCDDSNVKPPLLEVLAMDEDGLIQDRRIVDCGQITTVWTDFYERYSFDSIETIKDTLQSAFFKSREPLRNNIYPKDIAMQNLYNNRIASRSRPPSHHRFTLTKRQLPEIAKRSSHPSHFEDLLRNLLKVGNDRISRMVDSSSASDYLYKDFCQSNSDEGLVRKMVAAQVLTEDALSGGRFKRRSCQFVSARYPSEIHDGEEISVISPKVHEASFINGGWIAVDPSVKAGAEGRKFATLVGDANFSPSTGSNIKNSSVSSRPFTTADERVVRRLECLAMGDTSIDEWSVSDNGDRRLELDVRAALLSMNLPLTPSGAATALINIGSWTEIDRDKNNTKGLVEPWPPAVLAAARALARYEQRRRDILAQSCYSPAMSGKLKKGSITSDELEGRVDISALPCVCVDAKRTAFRDDGLGIRLRSSTGRKVNKAASKYEVLVHITDVSDLYIDDEKLANVSRVDVLDTELLRQSAQRRGESRYDMSSGPLHLLPPVALQALSLSTNQSSTLNRCVTVWAYIDERTGKLLEAGLERSIISSPTALSFADANSLLERGDEDVPSAFRNIQLVLSTAERHLAIWGTRHRRMNPAAQERDKRFATKEMIASELSSFREALRDDGVGGMFQRSRGHRLVDSSLELYAFCLATMMKKSNKPIPRVAGSGADRGGRLGTAPLRRYIDGMAQRQALSVLCDYGIPLSWDECQDVSNAATRARNYISNLSSSRFVSGSRVTRQPPDQFFALQKLQHHLTTTGGINKQGLLEAISTGHNNEIVLIGAGLKARVRGVKGTLAGGEKIIVQVTEIDPKRGVLVVRLV